MQSHDEYLISQSYWATEYILHYLEDKNFITDESAQDAVLFCLEHLGEVLNPISTSLEKPISNILLSQYVTMGLLLPCARLNQIRNKLIYNHARVIDADRLLAIKEHMTILKHKLACIIVTEGYKTIILTNHAYDIGIAKQLTNDQFLLDFYTYIGDGAPNDVVDDNQRYLTIGRAVKRAKILNDQHDTSMKASHALAFHIIAAGQAGRGIQLGLNFGQRLQPVWASILAASRNNIIHNQGIQLSNAIREYQENLLSLQGVVKQRFLKTLNDSQFHYQCLHNLLQKIPTLFTIIKQSIIILATLDSAQLQSTLSEIDSVKNDFIAFYGFYTGDINNSD